MSIGFDKYFDNECATQKWMDRRWHVCVTSLHLTLKAIGSFQRRVETPMNNVFADKDTFEPFVVLDGVRYNIEALQDAKTING